MRTQKLRLDVVCDAIDRPLVFGHQGTDDHDHPGGWVETGGVHEELAVPDVAFHETALRLRSGIRTWSESRSSG
jgi:hypothetical protein